MPKKSNISREKIIRTARDLFAVKGFHGASVRDIANSLGISISIIYHYFKSKEGLILAVLDDSTQELTRKLRHVAEQELDPLDRFKLLIKTHMLYTVKNRNRAKILSIINVGDEHLTPDGNRYSVEVQRRILDIYLQQLRKLEELGYLRFHSLSILAFNVLGTMNWLIRWYRSKGRMPFDDISEEIVNYVCHGILGPDIS